MPGIGDQPWEVGVGVAVVLGGPGTPIQMRGKGAAQGGGEPRPQRAGLGLPQHRTDVVVAVGIDGRAEAGHLAGLGSASTGKEAPH